MKGVVNYMEDNKDIEVVQNDDKDLEISPVYEHLNVAKPKPQEKKEDIIIPEIKNEDEKEEQDS